MMEQFSSSDFVGGVFFGMLASAGCLAIGLAVLWRIGLINLRNSYVDDLRFRGRLDERRHHGQMDERRRIIAVIESFKFTGRLYTTHLAEVKEQLVLTICEVL